MSKDNSAFKKRAAAFKSSCRVYRKEKERVTELEKQFPQFKTMKFEDGKFRIDLSEDNGRGMLELYQFLKDDITFVEDTFKKIEETCGANAKVLLWSLFVENHIQTNVAEDFGLTRRQLQYSVDKWLHEVFDDV